MNEARYYHPDTKKALISVTELLPHRAFFIDDDKLELCRQEGNALHAELKNGTGVFADIIPQIVALYGEIISQEETYYDKNGVYAGTPDMVCTNAIVDLKRTFVDAKYHALQLAGYYALLKDNGYAYGQEHNFIILTVDEDGKPKFRNVWNAQAQTAFSMCLNKHIAKQYVDKYLRTV